TRVAISVRIEEDEQRQLLQEDIEHIRANRGITHGFIARTSARGIDANTLASEVDFLIELWAALEQRIATAQAETLVRSDLPLALRMLRDLHDVAVENIYVDDKD